MRRRFIVALLLLTGLATAPAAASDWHRHAPAYGHGHGYGHGWRPAPSWHHPYRPPRYERHHWGHDRQGWRDDRRHPGWRRHGEWRHARPW